MDLANNYILFGLPVNLKMGEIQQTNLILEPHLFEEANGSGYS